MEKYTIYCTEEQINKALELGAELIVYAVEYDNSNRKDNEFYIMNDIVFTYDETVCRGEYGDLVYVTGEINKRRAYYTLTAEQMIGWLKTQGIYPFVEPERYKENISWMAKVYNINRPTNYHSYDTIFWKNYNIYLEATLAAIDAALDYLVKNKK